MMDIKHAIEILGKAVHGDGDLHDIGWYLNFHKGDSTACVDIDEATADQLEAIAVFMRHNGPKQQENN